MGIKMTERKRGEKIGRGMGGMKEEEGGRDESEVGK